VAERNPGAAMVEALTSFYDKIASLNFEVRLVQGRNC
jgi:hypothetical protein